MICRIPQIHCVTAHYLISTNNHIIYYCCPIKLETVTKTLTTYFIKKMKKKITRMDLAGIRNHFEILSEAEQKMFIGCGDGTATNPFTEYEANNMIDGNCFNGGYIIDNNGNICYWLPAVTVWGYSSGYGGFAYGFNYGYAYWQNEYPWNYYGYGNENNVYWPEIPGGDFLDNVEAITHAIKEHAGKTQLGSNCKLYFETKTGRVFYGNQYVGTTSLEGLGKVANKVIGRFAITVSVYNVAATFKNEGTEAGIYALGEEAGSWAGTIAGAKLGSVVGSTICPGPGSLIGAVIGAVGGCIGGSYIVEIFK